MSVLDAAEVFSLNQAITTTTMSQNAYDTVVPRGAPKGPGAAVLLVQTTADFVGGTSLQVNLISSPNTDLSSPTVLESSPAYPPSALVAGSAIARFRWPQYLRGAEQRYLGLQYVVVGTFSSGSITAGLVLDVPGGAQGQSGLNLAPAS